MTAAGRDQPRATPFVNVSHRERCHKLVRESLPADMYLGFELVRPYKVGWEAKIEAGFPDDAVVWGFMSTRTLDDYMREQVGPDLVLENEDFSVFCDGTRWVVTIRRDAPTNQYIEAPRSLRQLADWYVAVRRLEGGHD